MIDLTNPPPSHDRCRGPVKVMRSYIVAAKFDRISGVKRRQWTREELLQALSLYCQIPFGQMHARNRAIGKLATVINRTPSAIALKLVNFASLDPELRRRGVRGMGNVSQVDRDIWEEFYGKWEILADAIDVDIIAPDRGSSRKSRFEVRIPDGPTEGQAFVKSRRGQSFFRSSVMAAYEWKCCLTGIAAPELLRASHIVPWSQDVALRLDPHNGLCLNSLHDCAFDRGLISFTDSCDLLVSKRLKDEVPAEIYREMFERLRGFSIALPERFSPSYDSLAYHRDKIFLG